MAGAGLVSQRRLGVACFSLTPLATHVPKAWGFPFKPATVPYIVLEEPPDPARGLPWVLAVSPRHYKYQPRTQGFLQPADKYNDPNRVVPQCIAPIARRFL